MSEINVELQAAQQRIQVLERNLHDAEEANRRLAKQVIKADQRLSDANGEVLRLGFQLKTHLQLQAERDALAAKLAELEGQEPFDVDDAHGRFREAFEATLKYGNWPLTRKGHGYRSPMTQMAWDVAFGTVNRLKLYARPVPAEQPVNARLLGALSALLDDIEALIGESSGVYGLHLNGDVSPWSELEEGGRFERLSSMSSAREAIAAAESAPKAVRLTARECAMATSKSAHVRSDDMLEIARAIETAVLRKNGIEVAE